MTQTNSKLQSDKPGLLTPQRRRRLRAVALGLVILVCGFVLGAGVTVVGIKKMVHAIHTPGEAPKRITDRMRCRLGLSDDQASKVQAILTERQKALLAIFHDVQPRIQEELKRTKEEVSAVLDPEQAEKWREKFDHMQRRWVHPITAHGR